MEHSGSGGRGLVAPALSPDQLVDVLDRLAQLLDRAREPRWAQSMSQLKDAAMATSGTPERQDVVRRILAFYGGMGSFNDVVLQNERGVMPEQGEFDELRSQLFEVARDELA